MQIELLSRNFVFEMFVEHMNGFELYNIYDTGLSIHRVIFDFTLGLATLGILHVITIIARSLKSGL